MISVPIFVPLIDLMVKSHDLNAQTSLADVFVYMHKLLSIRKNLTFDRYLFKNSTKEKGLIGTVMKIICQLITTKNIFAK